MGKRKEFIKRENEKKKSEFTKSKTMNLGKFEKENWSPYILYYYIYSTYYLRPITFADKTKYQPIRSFADWHYNWWKSHPPP